MARRWLMLVAGVALGVGAVSQSGCVGYHAYPPIEGYPALTNPNAVNVQTVVITAMRWAVPRYAPDGSVIWDSPMDVSASADVFAVNMPEGVDREVYLHSVGEISENARALTPENEDLPTYHVVRVWIAGDEAKVDLLRPLRSQFGTNDAGHQPTQGLTINLRGGVKPWHVTAHKRWAVGSMEVPQAHYLPPATGRDALVEHPGVEH